MTFAWQDAPAGLGLVNFIVCTSLLVLLFGAIYYAFIKVFKRRTPFVVLSITTFFVFLSYLLNLTPVLIVSASLGSASIILCLMTNMGDLRNFLGNPFSKASTKVANLGIEKIFDRKALYKTIEAAVIELSNNKVGALMTFEKNTSLKEVIRNGVPVHAPVSVDLLLTIFYNGTRLHDGAVVIHGNEIVAAAVFFTPTTEPFAGKYGSRHRAAIGISEISDAITVVVSEETGRISFAVNGALETVEQSNFLRVFENYMDDDSK